MLCATDLARRPPLVIILAIVNFPHAQHVPQLSYRTIHPRLYIIYSYFHATAGFYRETRYSFRIPPGEQLARSPFLFFSVFSFPYVRYSRSSESTVFCFQPWKTPFAEDPVIRESVVVSDNGTARACLVFCRLVSFFLSYSRAAFGIAFSANNCEGSAYPHCLHKQLAEFLKLKILRRVGEGIPQLYGKESY